MGGVEKQFQKAEMNRWDVCVPRLMLSKSKHHGAVSGVFDDNLTVCSGCMTICGCPKAIESS